MTTRTFTFSVTAARSANVAWTAPATNTAGQSFDGSSNDRKISKYRVYYGTSQSAVQAGTSSYQDVPGTVTPYAPPPVTAVVAGLTPGTWWFRASAFDADGDESFPLDVNLDGVPDTFSKVIT